MRKQNKIISLILVVALLCSLVVFVPAAAADDASATSSFAPTATWESAANSNEAVSSASGNLLSSASHSNWNEESISAHLVTPANGDGKYITLVAETDKTTANHFLYVQGSSKATLDFASGYYVIEMDLASESGMIENFTINPILAFSGATSATRIDPNPNDILSKYTVLSDGNWHHYAMVGDLANNTLSIYIDGELVATKTAYNATNKATQDAANASTSYTFDSIRVNIGGNVAVTKGSSLSIDNIALTVGTTSTYGTAPAVKSLPAVATVDGESYSSVAAINNQLNGLLPVDVEILRDFAGTVTVNCDATVETNDCNGSVVAGTDVTVSADGVYDAPHKSSASYVDSTTTNTHSATSINGLRVDLSANYSDTSVSSKIVTDVVTGDQYLEITPGASFSTSDTTHNHWNWVTSNHTLAAGTFYVTEFDLYAESALMLDGYIGITCRNSANSHKGGNSFTFTTFALTAGEWTHFTMISSVDENTTYVYMNNTLVYSYAGGLYNSSYATAEAALADGVYFQGIRLNVAAQTKMTANQSIAIDNVSYKLGISDTWLDANYKANSIAAWPANSYDADYDFTSVPLLATVNGEPCYAIGDLNASLLGNEKKTVEIYRPYRGTISVNCDAVINTNGYGTPVAGTGVTMTNEGNVYTTDAPYQESLTLSDRVGSDFSAVPGAITAPVAGNLFVNRMQWNTTMTTDVQLKGYIATNNQTADQYLYVETHDGVTSSSNTYFETQSFTLLTYDSSATQYMVYDMDYAQMAEGAVPFMIVPRSTAGSGLWGGSVPSLNALVADKELGEFHHITFVVDVNNNKVYAFVDGVLFGSNYTYTSAANHSANFTGGAGVNFNGIRLASNATGSFALDNVAIRSYKIANTATNEIAPALASGDLSDWSEGICEAEAEVAPVASVNGKNVYTVAALNAALSAGKTQKSVEIFKSEASAITVNANAKVETNGLTVNLVAASGVTSTTEGTVVTFVAPWTSSIEETEVTKANFIIDSTVKNNLFTGRTGIQYVNNGNGEMAMYQVTDVETGNTYLKLQPTINGNASANVYLTTEIIPAATVGDASADCVLTDGQGYYVYDLDIATDGNIIETMGLAPSARNNASESGTFPFPSGFDLNKFVSVSDEWLHMTVIGDMAANIQYVYINGAFAGTAGVANAQSGTYPYLNVKGYRMNLAAGAAISKDQTILMDNLSCRVYKTVDASNGLADALAAGSLANWSDNIYEGSAKLPSLATINGVAYSSVDAITEILADGKDNVISLDRYTDAIAYATSTGTIITNGIDNFIEGAAGYAVVANDDGTYSIKLETRMGTITVNINGASAISADVLYGTDIAEYLYENNSYVFGVVSDDNGQVYTGATWDVAPAGVVDGDEVYNVTATAFENDVLVLDNAGNIVDSNADFTTIMKSGKSSDAEKIIVLNNDVVFAGNTTLIATKTVHMAGHTITFAEDTAGVHAIQLGNVARNITFINGAIIDDVRSNTQAIFYANYDFAYEVKVINCDLYAVGNFGNVRGGTFTFDNCNIVQLSCQNSYGFSICEYYNAGFSYNKCTLNIIDSDVRFNHFTDGRSQWFINSKDISEWSGTPSDADKANAIAKGADSIAHSINISGSTINMDFSAPVFNITNVNMNVVINNTQLNVKSLYKNMAGSLVIGDNVTVGADIDVSKATLGKGVVLVNNGDPIAPYAYVNEYATVTWSDGSVELWADGTIPANAACKTDAVCKVEAGKSYTFSAVENFALTMKANMTLDANLKFNVYIPTASAVNGVQIAKVVYDVASAEVVTVSDVECYKFVYEIAPYNAASSFAIVLTTADYVVAREFDVVEYADLVAAAYADDASANNLVKAILAYVAAAHKNMAVYVDGYNAAANYADPDEVTVDTATAVNTMANVNAYFESAQLNLAAAPKWIFNLVDGADISDLVIKVNGVAVEYVICNGYVEIELPAYDMIDTITVSVGGVSGEYNFAAYYAAQSALATSINPSTTSWQARENIEEAVAYFNMALLDAFYAYSYYAAAYNA